MERCAASGPTSAACVARLRVADTFWRCTHRFGTAGMRKVAVVDEPVSIRSRPDGSEQERRDAGGSSAVPECMRVAFVSRVRHAWVADLKVIDYSQIADLPSGARARA